MNYLKNLWNFVSAHTEFLDCTITTKDGILRTNKIFLWIFGSRKVFPKQSICIKKVILIHLILVILPTGLPDEGDLSILMMEYSTKEVISMCQRFVNCDNINITEEQDQVCVGEDADDAGIKQEGNVSKRDVPNWKFQIFCFPEFFGGLFLILFFESEYSVK